MDEEFSVALDDAGHPADEFEAPAAIFRPIGGVKLFAGPEDCPFGGVIEPFGVKNGAAVVVPQDSERERHGPIEALPGSWPVADDIPQADDFVNILRPDVLHDGFESRQVAMDVAEDCRSGQADHSQLGPRCLSDRHIPC